MIVRQLRGEWFLKPDVIDHVQRELPTERTAEVLEQKTAKQAKKEGLL